MAAEWRIDELERRSNGHGRSLESLSSRMAAVEQLANMLAGGMGGTFSSGSPKPVRIGKSTTAVTASTSTTPGTGTVQPLKLSGGVYADDGDPVTVRNPGAAIATAKRVAWWADADGVLWVTPEEC